MNLQQPAASAAGQQATSTAEIKPQARRRAWAAWALAILLFVLSLILAYTSNPASLLDNLLINSLGTPTLFAYATVGAIIAARRPENAIGWIFCAAAILVAFGSFAEEYARYALVSNPGSLPGGLLLGWLTQWTQDIGFILMLTFVMLLFPNGRLPSRRWRPVAWGVVGVIATVASLDAFRPGPLTDTLLVPNPLGIESLAGLINVLPSLLILAAIIACAAAVLVRFRRARGDERLQLKWFTYAAGLAVLQFGGVVLLAFSGNPVPDVVSTGLLILSIAAFPVAAGIAILKYHLYQIDLLINRTLVYVPLTAILAGLYSASLAVFQKLFLAATGAHSDAAIVLTTLLLVSSFTPIKNGLQGIVDKRFKEAPGPTKKLRAFGEQVRSFVLLNNPDRIAQRLLSAGVAAFDAGGGAIYLERDGHLHLTHVQDEWNGDAQLSIPLTDHGARRGLLALSARRSEIDYTAQDRQTLQEIVDVVTQAIELAGRTR